MGYFSGGGIFLGVYSEGFTQGISWGRGVNARGEVNAKIRLKCGMPRLFSVSGVN